MEDLTEVLSDAVKRLLKPLVRILLKNGLSFGSFTELAKQVYVDVAANEFKLDKRKQTDSRIAVLTGLSRKEVRRVRQLGNVLDPEALNSYNRAARVIHGWLRDRTFQDGWGEPAILPLEGEGATFTELIRKYGGDITARPVLDELVRVNAIERLADGRVKLIEQTYIPQEGQAEKLGILGMDVALLISTIDHNLTCPPDETFFQRKIAYNNLPNEVMPELKHLVREDGQALLQKVEKWMIEHDRDANPKASGSGRKYASLSVYFFEEDFQPEPDKT